MKSILLLLCLLISSVAFGQADMTLCHTSATEKFAMLASSKDFNESHQTPRYYIHVSQEKGKMINFSTPDGSEGSGYFLEARQKTNNWILVFQEW